MRLLLLLAAIIVLVAAYVVATTFKVTDFYNPTYFERECN